MIPHLKAHIVYLYDIYKQPFQLLINEDKKYFLCVFTFMPYCLVINHDLCSLVPEVVLIPLRVSTKLSMTKSNSICIGKLTQERKNLKIY